MMMKPWCPFCSLPTVLIFIVINTNTIHLLNIYTLPSSLHVVKFYLSLISLFVHILVAACYRIRRIRTFFINDNNIYLNVCFVGTESMTNVEIWAEEARTVQWHITTRMARKLVPCTWTIRPRKPWCGPETLVLRSTVCPTNKTKQRSPRLPSDSCCYLPSGNSTRASKGIRGEAWKSSRDKNKKVWGEDKIYLFVSMDVYVQNALKVTNKYLWFQHFPGGDTPGLP